MVSLALFPRIHEALVPDLRENPRLAPHENVTDSGQTRRREKLGF
ncbi:hypothetical protein [Mobiluncus mulieris]|nr:hypothetical protein [Mobiluncus mulieris]